MAFTACKFTELPLVKTSLPHLTSAHHHHRQLLSSSPFYIPGIPFSSSLNSQKPTTWLSKWATPNHSSPPPPPRAAQSNGQQSTTSAPSPTGYFGKDKGKNAIERIVLRLRNLGLGEEEEESVDGNEIDGGDFTMPVMGEERLGDLLKREWIRPDMILGEEDDEEDDEEDELALPWEREEANGKQVAGAAAEGSGFRRRTVKAPTLAELTIEDEELRRLRRNGMFLRERISVPKAGLKREVLEKIHDKWRKQELVRLKFHEVLARDMKTAHELVEVVFWSFALLLGLFSVSLCSKYENLLE